MAILDLHHPWVFAFGIMGNIISLCVYFAPVPTFNKIRRSKSTLGFQSLPYVVALFSAMLWMYYALLKKNSTLLISINSIGCVIETAYIAIYLFYAQKAARRYALQQVAGLNLGLFVAIFVATHFLFEGAIRISVVGWICVAFSVVVFAAPLSIVFQVVRTKSAEFMPFTLSLFLTLSAVMWFGYGVLSKDMCITLPNVLGFFLGMLQMILYGIYRNKPNKMVVPEKAAKQEQVINIVILANSEIPPTDSPKTRSCADEANNDEQKANSRTEKFCEKCEPMDQKTLNSPVVIVCGA